MSLRSEITATYQQITLDVRVGGRSVSEVFEVNVSLGFDQQNAQATLVCHTRPSWAVELQTVQVWAGYNGLTVPIFTGELSGISWDYFPGGIALDARGLLARLRYPWGSTTRTYTIATDASIIQNLVEAYGIPSRLTHIESSGWILGQINDVTLEQGENAWQLVERIDNLAGYKTYEDAAGVVRRSRVSGNPSPGAFWTFQKGVDLFSVKRVRSLDDTINRCVVDGYEYQGVSVSGTASAANAYIPSPPGTVCYEVQDNLVETNDYAGSIAARIVGDRNRRPEHLELESIGNPLIQPGMTVGVEHSDLEVSGGRVWVAHVEHRISASSFTTSIQTTGGNLSGYDASAVLTAPVAILDVKIFKEGTDNGGTVSALYVGIADGSQSYDPDGTVVTYGFSGTATGGTFTAYGGTTSSVYRFGVSGTPSVISVTLVVTDAGGATGTATWSGTVAALTFNTEALYTAEGTIIAASIDGQQTWQTAAISGGSATCLAPFAPPWGEVWGASSGVVYATTDNLYNGTATSLGSPHGGTAVTSVSVHELNTERIWAGFQDGRVAFSPDRGTTWLLRGTAAGVVNEIRESYTALDTIYVTAGSVYQVSFNGGNTFSGLGTAGAGGTAWRMAGGWGKNWWSQLGAAAYIRDEDGGTVAFSPGTPTAIRGISPGWRVQELYAADGAGSAVLYKTGSDFATATAVGTVSTQVNHVIRSGNEDGIVYLAGDNGVYKTFQMASPQKIRDTGSRRVHMVGYGNGGTPPTPFRAILIPYGASGGNDVIQVYSGSTNTWGTIAPPRPGWYWEQLVANPLNPNEWLIYGVSNTSRWAARNVAGTVYGDNGGASQSTGTYSPLWRSTNAGTTWAQVTLTIGGLAPGTAIFVDRFYITWLEQTANVWQLTGNTSGIDNDTYFWRGTAGAAGSALWIDNVLFNLVASGEGANFLTAGFASPYNMAYSAAGGLPSDVYNETDNTKWFSWSQLERSPNTRSAIGWRSNGAVWRVIDYKNAGGLYPVEQVVTVGATSFLTIATHGVYMTGGSGPRRVDNALTSGGTVVSISAFGNNTIAVRAGRQQRQAVAWLTDGYQILSTTDGTSFKIGPAAPVTTNVRAIVEVAENV